MDALHPIRTLDAACQPLKKSAIQCKHFQILVMRKGSHFAHLTAVKHLN
jgi:hypothetical protein